MTKNNNHYKRMNYESPVFLSVEMTDADVLCQSINSTPIDAWDNDNDPLTL